MRYWDDEVDELDCAYFGMRFSCPFVTASQDKLHFRLRPDNDTTQRLPALHLPATAFAALNGRNIFLIFGGRDIADKTSSDLIALDVDSLEWWVVHVDGGPVMPRRAADMTDRLYIFGGDYEPNRDDNNLLESFSIAEYRHSTDRWTWVVLDEPYPGHVPSLGYQCSIAPVYGGKKILLLPGREDADEASSFSYNVSQF